MSNNYFSPRIILAGVFHIAVVIILLFLLDIGLFYFLHFLVYKIFNPFNGFNFFLKIFVLLIGGFILFSWFLTFTQRVTALAGGLIFNRVKGTEFTQMLAYVITIANAIYNIVWIWRTPVSYNFWIVCELFMISFFIWSLNYIVLPAKEQVRLYKREDEIVSRF